jgi:hypothetical protein
MVLLGQPLQDLFVVPEFHFLDKNGVSLGSGTQNNAGAFIIDFNKVGLIEKFVVSSETPGVYITGTVGTKRGKGIDLAIPSLAVGPGDTYTVFSGSLVPSGSIMQMEPPASLWTRIKDKVKGWTQ